MMKSIYMHFLQVFATFLIMMMSFSGFASDKNLELAVERGCLTCHSVKHDPTKKIKLAPSYEEVAARYKGEKDAAEYLIERVMDGTVNHKQNWKGEVNMRFMPPNVNVSKIEASSIVNWILDIKNKPVNTKLVKHEQMMALAIHSGCTVCHAINKNPDHRFIPLAPAYREIAARFGSQKDARKELLDSVIHGTLNKEKHWKNVNMRFMPPNLALSKENAEKLVDWILSL